MKTVVVNLFGGPGSGKSTLSCELFALLKRHNYQVELVREYAKDWAYERRHIDTLMKQTYILAKQARRESMLYGKVNCIITDCPIALSGFYCEKYLHSNSMTNLVKEFLKESQAHDVEHIYFQVPRRKKYNPNGRFETEEQAKKIDTEQVIYFKENNFSPITLQDAESILSYEIIDYLVENKFLG